MRHRLHSRLQSRQWITVFLCDTEIKAGLFFGNAKRGASLLRLRSARYRAAARRARSNAGTRDRALPAARRVSAEFLGPCRDAYCWRPMNDRRTLPLVFATSRTIDDDIETIPGVPETMSVMKSSMSCLPPKLARAIMSNCPLVRAR